MKFHKINYKGIACVLLSSFIVVSLSGCSKENNSIQHDEPNYKVTEQYEKENITEESKEEIKKEESSSSTTSSVKEDASSKTDSKKNTTSTSKETTSNQIEYSAKDKEAITAFNSLKENVDQVLNSESVTSAKDKAKGAFITVVDFLFYDSEINGVTFDELTDAGKQQVLKIANSIDTKIESKFPGYKETIYEKTKKAFNKASELIKKGANNVKDFAKDKLGEENYDAIVDAKDDIVYYTKKAVDIIGDVGSELFDKGKEYIKNWYENLKRD